MLLLDTNLELIKSGSNEGLMSRDQRSEKESRRKVYRRVLEKDFVVQIHY